MGGGQRRKLPKFDPWQKWATYTYASSLNCLSNAINLNLLTIE
jgi:hypothetical protein